VAQYRYIDISAISALHELRDSPYHAKLVESLEKRGWQGRPLLGVQCDPKVAWDQVEHNGCSRTKVTLLTGSHRYGSLVEVKKRGKWPFNLPRNHVPVVVLGPDEFKADGWERIRGAVTDPQRLEILHKYARDPDAVLLMEEELKSNRRTTRIVNVRRHRRKNLFGFGKAKPGKPSHRLRKRAPSFEGSNTIKGIAFDHGYNDARKDYDRNLDTDDILNYISGQAKSKDWVKKIGASKIASTYRHEYRQGKRKWKVEEKKKQSEEKKETKSGSSGVVSDVIDGLVGQGMSRAEAKTKARHAYKSGDTFDSLFRKVMKKANPAKFDRCVADVKKSLKAQKRPGNAYAICTAAGARNPESSKQLKSKGWKLVDRYATRATAEAVTEKYAPYRLINRSGKWEVWTRQKLNPPKTKQAENARVVWTAKQGKLKAIISKSLLGSYQVRIMGGPRVLEEFSPKKFDEAVAIARLRLADTGMQRGNPVHDLIPGAGSLLKTVDKTGAAWKGLGKRVARGVSKTFHPSKSRKNPMDVALKRYEEFHGMPSAEILEFEEKEHHHSAKVGLGQLVSMLVTLINGKIVPLNSPGFSEKGSNGRKYWEFDQKTPIVKRVYLTSSEDGRQLFIDGGDQSIPTEALRGLGITADDEHDHMLIGTIDMITYRTRKTFEDKGKNELDFFHKFGGEGSRGVAPVLLYFKRSEKLRIAGGRYKIAPPRKDLGSVSPGIVG